MWILKIKKDLLETLKSRLLSEYNSIRTCDFSTLYISIPRTQLKFRLKNTLYIVVTPKKTVHLDTNMYIVLGKDSSYFKKTIPNLQMFFNRQHTCPVQRTRCSTNGRYSNGYKLCSSTSDLFLHSYEADFNVILIQRSNIV